MGSPRGRQVLAGVAAVYLAGLAVLVGGPWGWALNRLTVACYVQLRYDWPVAPEWVGPEHYGVLLNVVLFVPLGGLFVLLTQRSWWQAALVAAAASTVVEVVQGLWLARQGTWQDVAANTAGAALGAVVVVSLLARRR